MRLVLILALALCALASGAARAQTAPGTSITVGLSNGDRLSGTLLEETEHEVTIDHSVLGRITLPRTAPTPPPAPAAGPVVGSDEPPARKPVLVSGIEAPKDTPWSGKIGLSMNYTDNTKTSFNGRLSGSIEKKTDDEHFHFGGWYLLQYNNGKLSQNKAFMELSQDWLQPDSPWMTFFDAQYQYNRYEAWEHQLSPNAGVGYTVWDTLEYGLTLKGGAGARYRYTDRQLDGQLYLRADGRLQVARDQEFAGFLQLTPAFDDPGNTQGIVQLNYTIKMDIGVPFSTKVFLQNNFDTEPGPGDTANDLTIGVGMEYAF